MTVAYVPKAVVHQLVLKRQDSACSGPSESLIPVLVVSIYRLFKKGRINSAKNPH